MESSHKDNYAFHSFLKKEVAIFSNMRFGIGSTLIVDSLVNFIKEEQ